MSARQEKVIIVRQERVQLRDMESWENVHCCRQIKCISACRRESSGDGVWTIKPWYEFGNTLVTFLYIIMSLMESG